MAGCLWFVGGNFKAVPIRNSIQVVAGTCAGLSDAGEKALVDFSLKSESLCTPVVSRTALQAFLNKEQQIYSVHKAHSA